MKQTILFNFSPFPNLETERLILRQPIATDDEAYFRIRSNTEVNKYIGRDNYKNIAQAQEFITRINNNIIENDSVFWTMELKLTHQVIGTICLWNLSIEENSAEIGYEMHPDFFGLGYMQEAIKVVIEYGFKSMNVQNIYGVPSIKNTKSVKILESFGFTRDIDAEKTMLRVDEIGVQVYYVLKNNINI